VNIESVQVGDHLYIRDHYRGHLRLFKVDRVTKVHAICRDEKFRLNNGQWVGTSGWAIQWASIATPEIVREYSAQRLRTKIRSYCEAKSFDDLPLESLEIIFASLPISKVEGVGT
jgi:hypothetical protein